MSKVCIVGGGISGYGCAFYLRLKNEESIIFESSSQAGGRAATVEKNGYQFEIGGKNFSSEWKEFHRLLQHGGISEHEYDHQHARFHILISSELIGLEKSKALLSGLSMVRHIGVFGALQFNRLLNISAKKRDIFEFGGEELRLLESKLDNQTIDKKYSRKLAYGPLRMFSIIMGGAEPDEMYPVPLMKFLSGFGKGTHYALRGGLGRLFQSLSANYETEFACEITKINIENGKVQSVTMNKGGQEVEQKTSRVIVSLPVHQLPKLLDLPDLVRQQVERVNYFPVVLINVVYDKPVFNESMNSIMFDETYALGHCSANRVNTPNHVRFTLSGRISRELLDKSDDELMDIAETEFRKVLPITGQRVEFHVAKHRGGLCAYTNNHSTFKTILENYIESVEGLEVSGDYLEGHAMGDCLRSSQKAVDRMLSRSLNKQKMAVETFGL